MSPTTDPFPSLLAARPGRVGVALAGFGSLLALGLGCWWLVRPDRHAFAGDPDPLSVPSSLPGDVSSIILIVLGTMGVLTAAVTLAAGSGPRWRPLLTVIGLVECLGFTAFIADASLLMAMGYLMAGLVPIGLGTVAILVCRRSVAMRWITASVIIAGGAWAIISPTITLQTVPDLIMELIPVLLRLPISELLLAAFALTAIGWGLLARHLLQGTRVLARAHVVVSRIGVVATWLAAAGPIPYALLRLSWLTPWAQFGPADISGDLRIWGLLLGGGAITGSVLTIGLLRRWGRIFPSWIPFAGGRSVPVLAAVIPATGVGLAITVAAGPILLGPGTTSIWPFVTNLIIFPFWLWGPALLIATWAYALRRQQDVEGGSGARGREPGTARGVRAARAR